MARPERPLDPSAGPLQKFADELRNLRKNAGNPSYHTLGQRTGYSVATLAEAARGERRPTLKVTVAYARGCGADPKTWEKRWYRLTEEMRAGSPERGLTTREQRELETLRREVAELRNVNAALRRASGVVGTNTARPVGGGYR